MFVSGLTKSSVLTALDSIFKQNDYRYLKKKANKCCHFNCISFKFVFVHV